MVFPDFLEEFRAHNLQKRLPKPAVGHILFSNATYQVEVKDGAESYWVFVQLDGRVCRDIFCDCATSQEKGGCPHMLSALETLFKGKEPLGDEFEKSFLKKLFWLFFYRQGADSIARDYKKNRLQISNKRTGKILFTAVGVVENILLPGPVETEETSIKFSNLTDEEIDNWRRGCPSEKLQFELSPLADLAKELFVQSFQNVPLQLLFNETGGLPTKFSLQSPTLTIQATLSQQELTSLIPTLDSISTNLPLIRQNDLNIKKISFDEEKACLIIERKRTRQSQLKAAQKPLPIGPYSYIKGAGFTTHEAPLPLKETISGPTLIADTLERFSQTLPTLCDFPITTTKQELIYSLAFDANHDLTIRATIPEIGTPTHQFGDSFFVPNKGFFKILLPKFSTPTTTIPNSSIAAFILHNRAWLSQFPGFTVHLVKLPQQIHYIVDKQGSLTFFQTAKEEPFPQQQIDCGSWLFYPNDGFFLKEQVTEGPPLPLNTPIMSLQVASFIRSHENILSSIDSFFSPTCPITGLDLTISLLNKNTIAIEPCYHFQNKHLGAHSHQYDEFFYTPTVGFYKLPSHLYPSQYLRHITRSDPTQWHHFFTELLPKLKSQYTCHIDPKLETASALSLVAKAAPHPSTFHDAWDVNLLYTTPTAQVSLSSLLTAIRQNERFLPTGVGLVDLHERRFAWLHAFDKKKYAHTKQGFRLKAQDLLFLNAIDPLTPQLDPEQNQTILNILNLHTPQPPNYTSLTASLRPYQQLGVDWLWFLYSNSLSGLLCDDMGVGKTHQALALIASILHSTPATHKPKFLILCPASLVFHWQDKIASTLPNIKVNTYTGPERDFTTLNTTHWDVLLTTYGVWRNESRNFHPFFFQAAFFDELQIAKSHLSQIYSALLDVRATTKIGLTGTPIENRLRELKALFDIVLPNYMPHDSDFRDLFTKPIEKEHDETALAQLTKFVRPFILRRSKHDVLPDLPIKIEESRWTNLIGEQKILYSTVAQRQIAPLIELVRNSTTPIPYLHIFSLLSSLKQICNHPAAYLKDTLNFELYESGKWDAFTEILDEAHESQQKLVVFSHYLAMLDIICLYLNKTNTPYAHIRGSTTARKEEIERFTNDPNCTVFVGSLATTGLGIDLTAASIVVHYDRWWNPARENQATDRVYRFGQKRGVQVFKLITKNTIEEKIDSLISHKQSLLSATIPFDDSRFLKQMDRSQLLSLLEEIQREL